MRRELAKCSSEQWIKANAIMRSLTLAMNKRGGPMGGVIQPRVCKHCGFFGHTKQHCSKRKHDEAEAIDREIKEDKAERDAYAKRAAERLYSRENVGRESSADMFDRMGIEWDWHPAGIGPFPKWYLEERAGGAQTHKEQTQACGSSG